MKNQIRTFLAIDLSTAVRTSVSKWVRSFKDRIQGTHWVEPENFHLTLKFLGDVPLNELPRIIATLTAESAKHPAFELDYVGCGAFPNISSPKTVWVGCREGSSELTQLAQGIEEALFQLGYPKENRRFSPHLTIGRIKKSDSLSMSLLSERLEQDKELPFGCCSVDEITLYSSELTRRGPIYDHLATMPLALGDKQS